MPSFIKLEILAAQVFEEVVEDIWLGESLLMRDRGCQEGRGKGRGEAR